MEKSSEYTYIKARREAAKKSRERAAAFRILKTKTSGITIKQPGPGRSGADPERLEATILDGLISELPTPPRIFVADAVDVKMFGTVESMNRHFTTRRGIVLIGTKKEKVEMIKGLIGGGYISLKDLPKRVVIKVGNVLVRDGKENEFSNQNTIKEICDRCDGYA